MMKPADSVRQLLADSPLGKSLDDAQISQLADCAIVTTLPRSTTVFVEGSSADALRIICSGSIALDMHVPPRGSVRILTLGPDDVLGWSALVGDGHMSATATVLEEARLIVLPADVLMQFCDRDANFGQAVMHHVARTLARRLRETRLQLLDLFANGEIGKSTQ